MTSPGQGLNPIPLDHEQHTLPTELLQLVENYIQFTETYLAITQSLKENYFYLDQGLNPGPLDYEHETLPTELLELVENYTFLAEPYSMVVLVYNYILMVVHTMGYRPFLFFILCSSTAYCTCSGCCTELILNT